MSTLLTILLVLFLALVILIPLIEKISAKGEPQDYSRLSRWIIPLMALLIVLQMIRHFFF